MHQHSAALRCNYVQHTATPSSIASAKLCAVSMELQCRVWGADVGTSLPKLSTYRSSSRYPACGKCDIGNMRSKYKDTFLCIRFTPLSCIYKNYWGNTIQHSIYLTLVLIIMPLEVWHSTYIYVIWTLLMSNPNVTEWLCQVSVYSMYWGRLRKKGTNYKDKYNHSWTLVCQHTYPSQEVASTGLLNV